MGNQFKNPFEGVKGFADTWYTFMSFCGFYLTAIAFFFLGLGSLIGWQYGKKSFGGFTVRYVDGVKESYGGLRALDIILGIVFIAAAFAAIYIGMQFKAKKAVAPKFTTYLYCGFLALYVLYNFIVLITLPGEGKTDVYPIVFPIILIIIFAAVVVLNFRYFKERGAEFTN